MHCQDWRCSQLCMLGDAGRPGFTYIVGEMHEYLNTHLGINEAQFHGGDWQGNQCRKFLGTQKKSTGQMRPNWREVMAKLKQLALPSTMVCQDLALDGDCCRLVQLLSLPHDGGDICNLSTTSSCLFVRSWRW